MTGDPTRVLIVDDHALLADSLVVTLQALGMRVAHSTGEGGAGEVLRLAVGFRPHVVLLDLALGREDGVALVAPLKGTGAHVVAVSGTADVAQFAAAVREGALGWLSKSAPFTDLLTAVRTAAVGRPLLSGVEREALLARLSSRDSERADARRRLARLTPAERQVLDLLCAGRSAAHIAAELVVSLHTVRTHIRGIRTKLDVTAALAAVALVRAASATAASS